ncbi:MAG: hypothetical protein PWQ09_1160 [Candidatus Cloacimonadota bacterium]|jgi:CRISPR/Cas system CSM-associated protein Csm3 (group 7 of RAMP superfamily)|nr:hypothetical protein [Candidatus Cloacimonadota bacterium]
MSDNNNIKILYKAGLNLQTALHVGCAQKSPVGSFEMMQNGAGEYIIPGTSIAGVFFDTLRDLLKLEGKKEEISFLFARCISDNNTIYLVPKKDKKLLTSLYPQPTEEKIELKAKAEEFLVVLENLYHNDEGKVHEKYKNIFRNIKKYRKNFGSPLVFRSINLSESIENINDKIKIRNRTKINRKTKTAEEGELFSYWEIEPEGVSLDIHIEIDNLSVKNKDKDIETLQNWVKMVFASWQKEGVFFGAHNTSGNGYCKLQQAEEWIIDSEELFEKYIKSKNPYAETFRMVEFTKPSEWSNPKPRFKTWEITVDMNDEDEGYGTNALLIKGGVTHSSLAGNPSDGVFINTGERLFIPGSSLKGTFSMFLEKYGKSEWLKDFFGQEGSKNQGYIYFPDLIFSTDMNDKKKHLINIERHAEDEFTRAVFGSGKFNEERLFYAKAEGKIRVPKKIYDNNKTTIDEMFKFLVQGCEHRLISLGANGCYPKITIKEGE